MGSEPNVGPLNYSVDFLKGITDTWPWISPVMASESEKTPESVEVKALEDLKAEHGALRPCGDSGEPSGRPVSYGPGDGAMNRDRERGSLVEVNETLGVTCPC